MDLNSAWRRLESSLSFHAGCLTSDMDLEERLQHAERVSDCLEGFGICHLIMDGEVEKFRLRLSEAASAVAFLQRIARERSLETRLAAVSRTDAFFDAVIAGNQQVSTELAQVFLGIAWREDWEYEEDFCYRQSLHAFWLEAHQATVEPPELDHWLSRMEDLEASTQLEIILALKSRNAESFLEAVLHLLEKEEERIAKLRPSRSEADCWFWPRAFVSVQGLAIIRLAEACGIEVHASFPRCPPEALGPLTKLKFSDPFATLEQIVQFK